MAVFGYTKVGKTTSCHLLCGSPLRAFDNNGELIYKPTTSRFSQAKIGATAESETEIPNIFEAQIKEKGVGPAKMKKICILDQPGYGDSYGFHRIFSNGYFHYRTFSKTPKLKFILAIHKNDLTGTAEKFKKTIFNFINSFKGWDSIKGGILEATSFLVTKADPETKYENMKNIIVALRDSVKGMGAMQTRKYQEIIDEMLKNNRIFIIEKPKNKNASPMDNTILQKIYDST